MGRSGKKISGDGAEVATIRGGARGWDGGFPIMGSLARAGGVGSDDTWMDRRHVEHGAAAKLNGGDGDDV
jgi:hypothetical protein